EVELDLLERTLDQERRIGVHDRSVAGQREAGGDADHQLFADADVEGTLGVALHGAEEIGPTDLGQDQGQARGAVHQLARRPLDARSHRRVLGHFDGTSATTASGRPWWAVRRARSIAARSWPSTVSVAQPSSANRCASPEGQPYVDERLSMATTV